MMMMMMMTRDGDDDEYRYLCETDIDIDVRQKKKLSECTISAQFIFSSIFAFFILIVKKKDDFG